jgi:hypothetical protein
MFLLLPCNSEIWPDTSDKFVWNVLRNAERLFKSLVLDFDI